MFSFIVAYDKSKIIGNNGHIPWRIPGEQKKFKNLTIGHVVVMGRRTYEEIGHPLPGRTNIVISTKAKFECENCSAATSLQEAIKMAEGRDVFIAGGVKLYEEALGIADKLYVTEIDSEFDGDTYFPNFDETDFIKVIDEVVTRDIPYRYVTYTRKEKEKRL